MSDGPYNIQNDKISSRVSDDTRKEEISLKDLNRLKKLKAYRQVENLKRKDTLETIYGSSDGDSGDMGI